MLTDASFFLFSGIKIYRQYEMIEEHSHPDPPK